MLLKKDLYFVWLPGLATMRAAPLGPIGPPGAIVPPAAAAGGG